MPRTRRNVVVDANVVVSALLRPGSVPHRALDTARFRFELCVSAMTLAELQDVLSRPRLLARIGAGEARIFLLLLAEQARRIDPGNKVADSRDVDDNAYLELALAADAFAIVTGDRDLLDLDPWRGIPIVTPAGFLALAAYDSPGAR